MLSSFFETELKWIKIMCLLIYNLNLSNIFSRLFYVAIRQSIDVNNHIHRETIQVYYSESSMPCDVVTVM